MSASATSSLCLPAGYRENPVCYFVDDVTQQRGVVFQPDVYAMAEWLAEVTDSRNFADVGCGRADKLAAIHGRHPDWLLTGVDFGENLIWCDQHYDWGFWYQEDLENGIAPLDGVVVCADVIEHLADPVPLLQSLAECDGPVVLSTPERDLMYGGPHMGPPQNLCHVREWNMGELRELLTRCGLDVKWMGLSRSSDQSDVCVTQLAVCQ